MSTQCKCGSYAINHNCHGRDGSDGHLCDVCYWRSRAAGLAAVARDMDECYCQIGNPLSRDERLHHQQTLIKLRQQVLRCEVKS